MNENERTPAETAADYAVHFADGFFAPALLRQGSEKPGQRIHQRKGSNGMGARRV